MDVRLVDLRPQYAQLKSEIDSAIARVLERQDFILGHDVAEFEREFAAYCEADHAVGLDTGISALELALRALGVGPGDEVITVSHTFIASVSAISFTGATPVMIEVEPDTGLMDSTAIEAAITERTRAILPVHLYGQPVDMDPILEIARARGLVVVEDACQAHGARYKGRRVGALGDAGAFSFYPGKNLGAYGDGGALVTCRADVAERVRLLRNYGQREKYHHINLAYNRRLDTLQAAILRVKLPHLDDGNAARARAAGWYRDELSGIEGLQLPVHRRDRSHVYHLFPVQLSDREALLKHLNAAGVGAGLHYPVPVHRQECYRDLDIPADALPVSNRFAARELSLPIYPEITREQIAFVGKLVREFFSV